MTRHGTELAQVQIRRADADDGDGIVACLRAAFARYRDQYTTEAFADTVLDSDSVQHRLQEMSVFVAVTKRTIVGTIGCYVRGTEGHLRGMAVSVEWQGTGLASALLKAAENQLLKQGCKRVTLDTTGPLTRAIRFYEKNGFSASGRISDFYGMRLYEYTKPLSGPE